eukprot:6171922-Pyramimonas_sp.AAC.1
MIRVASQARKVGEIVGNKNASNISDKLYNMRDHLEERQSVFQRLRENFCDVVLRLSDNDMKHVKDAPADAFLGILAHFLHNL